SRRKAAVDVVDKNDGRGKCAADVDNELDNLDPNNRFDPAVKCEDHHHKPEQDYRNRDRRRNVAAGNKARINRCENDRRQQKPNSVRDISHYNEKARRKHFYLVAETFAEKLVNRLKFAAEIKR